MTFMQEKECLLLAPKGKTIDGGLLDPFFRCFWGRGVGGVGGGGVGGGGVRGGGVGRINIHVTCIHRDAVDVTRMQTSKTHSMLSSNLKP